MKDKYHKIVNGKTVAVNLPKVKHGDWPIDKETEKNKEAVRILYEAFWSK